MGFAASVLAALLLGAAPAQAVADFKIAVADGPVPWTLTVECSLVGGYTTNADEIRFVFKATAHGGGAALATQVGCSAYREDGTRVGACSTALIGPATACATSGAVPFGEVPAFCVTASALYATGVAQLPTCPDRL